MTTISLAGGICALAQMNVSPNRMIPRVNPKNQYAILLSSRGRTTVTMIQRAPAVGTAKLELRLPVAAADHRSRSVEGSWSDFLRQPVLVDPSRWVESGHGVGA